jgi:hypothetical protein
LKEFFNAQGLDKILDGIKKQTGESKIETFWHKKHTIKGPAHNIGELFDAITNLRGYLINLGMSLVNDGGKKTLYQQANLADIELEKYLFMRVSEVLAKGGDVNHIKYILIILLKNLTISSLEMNDESELTICTNELNSIKVTDDISLL